MVHLSLFSEVGGRARAPGHSSPDVAPGRSEAGLEERRAVEMRRLFPKLYGRSSVATGRPLPGEVYAYLAAASTVEDLEQRLRARPLPGCPTDLIEEVRLKSGGVVLVRPVLPRDAVLLGAFVRTLSAESRRRRFHGGVAELPESVLRYLAEVDQVNHLALVAEVGNGGGARLVADARWVRRADEPDCADFAIAVADDQQRAGLGAHLMDRLERSAAERGVRRLHGDILRSNVVMSRWLLARGWRLARDPDDPLVECADLTLTPHHSVWREAA